MGRGGPPLPRRPRGGRELSGTIARAFAVEEAAERELARVPDWLWDGESLPVPVEAIADSHYGLRVREGVSLGALAGLPGDAGASVSGLLLPGAKEIWVDAGEARIAPPRRRFTVGHELGHWVLDCRLGAVWSGQVVHCRESQVREQAAAPPAGGAGDPGREREPAPDYPPAELDANQFAAALLMPRRLVLAAHERLGGDERALCEAFRVSGLAMQRRLWFLGIRR